MASTGDGGFGLRLVDLGLRYFATVVPSKSIPNALRNWLTTPIRCRAYEVPIRMFWNRGSVQGLGADRMEASCVFRNRTISVSGAEASLAESTKLRRYE